MLYILAVMIVLIYPTASFADWQGLDERESHSTPSGSGHYQNQRMDTPSSQSHQPNSPPLVQNQSPQGPATILREKTPDYQSHRYQRNDYQRDSIFRDRVR